MKRLSFTAILILLSACSAQPTVSLSGQTESRTDLSKNLQAEVQRLRQAYELPGMTAAIVIHDGERVFATAGYADKESSLEMAAAPRMLAASIGKSFVGALAVSLATEERLDLDVPVSRWLNKYHWFERVPNHKVITLRHLLTHSAGLPDHVHMPAFQQAFVSDWRAKGNVFPVQRLIGFILDKPPLFEAGKGWSYSDTGYLLAGLILEEVTGKTYYQQIEERFLQPLGLRDTSASDRRELQLLATGYLSEDNPFGLPKQTKDENGHLYLHPGIEWTGGGLVTTSLDLAQWGDALFAGAAISDNARKQLFSSIPVDPKNADVSYGAGVSLVKYGSSGSVYGHAGWIPGYVSSMRYYPDAGVTIAFQINTDAGKFASEENAAAKIEQALLQVVLQQLQ